MANVNGVAILSLAAVVAVLAIVWVVLRGDRDRMADDTTTDESADTGRAGGEADSDLVNIEGLNQISADDLDGAQNRLEDKYDDEYEDSP